MARRSVRLLASIAAVATMASTFAACGNKQATTDENGKPIVNILVRRNVTDHPMQDTQYTKDWKPPAIAPSSGRKSPTTLGASRRAPRWPPVNSRTLA